VTNKWKCKLQEQIFQFHKRWFYQSIRVHHRESHQTGFLYWQKGVLHEFGDKQSRAIERGRKTLQVKARRQLVKCTKFAPQVMMSARVCFEVKGRLHFVEERARVNASYYMNALLTKWLEVCHRLLDDDFAFQQVPCWISSTIWIIIIIILTCLSGSGDWDTVHTDQDGLSEEPGSIPRSAGRLCVRIPGAHALRLIFRAGKEGSTVSSTV